MIQSGTGRREQVGVDDERSAYLRAYALFEAVQGHDSDDAAAAVAPALEQAEARGWTSTAFVLAAACVVHAITRAGTPAADLRRLTGDLLARAEAADATQPSESSSAAAFVAMALGLRALTAAGSGDASALLSDASRAVALLDEPSLPALDRSTAYVVVAAAFNTMRLWELVDDLYDQAMTIGHLPDAPGQVPAVAVNRVLTRLEWALALVENRADDDARHQLERVLRAADEALEHDLPTLFRRDVEAGALAARLLLGDDVPAGEVAALRQALREQDDIETEVLLAAAWALTLLRAGRLDAAVAALDELGEVVSATSGARGFPLWVSAQVLAAADPTAATAALRQHGELLGDLLWRSRTAVLTSASAQIAVERRRLEHERLFRDVHTDPLTGLLNRRTFDAWLGRPADDGPPGTLLLVDVDDFKAVNDTFGHDVGDEVLRQVARAMRSRVRFGDRTVRHGGDEFAVLVDDPALGPQAALDRGRQLLEAIRQTDWTAIADGLVVTVSIGVAGPWSPDGGLLTDPRAVYRAADSALYDAKRARGGVAVALAG
jgi:diguanylate cyclase (GGDEF)-like protein